MPVDVVRTRGTEGQRRETCGSPRCGHVVHFLYDVKDARDLPVDRSLIVKATCRYCDAPQHLLVWSTGEVSGPWLVTH